MSTFVLNNPYPITSVGPVSADLDDYVMNPMHEHGDIIYGGVAGIPQRLEGNTTTTHQFLKQTGDGTNAGHPVWVSPLASEIVNTPAGSISSIDVQAAINELDTGLTTLSSTVGELPLCVPYTGATDDIDLGTQGITTTGTVTAGLVTGVVPYTGATGNVDLGTYDISVGKVTIADAVVNATDAATKAYVDSEIAGIVVINGTDGVDGADGADGAAGVDSRTVVLTVDYQHFDYNSTGTTPSPSSATITATSLNTVGIPYYSFWLNDVEVQNDTTGIYVYTPEVNVSNMPSKIEVELREGDPYEVVLARDQITMIGLREGSDGVTVVLSNEAHTLSTSNTGTVDYTGSGTNIYVWVGTTEMAVDQTAAYGNNTFRVTNAVGTNITVGTASGADGSFVRTYGDHSNMTANNASITYTIVIKSSAGTEITVTKTQSFAKSIEGADGVGGTGSRAVNLTTATQGFVYNTSGAVPSPANTTITATPLNTVGTPWYEFLKDGSSEQNTTSATYNYTPQSSYANMPDVIEVRMREDGAGNPVLARDQITLVGLKAGAHGATIMLTNEAHTLPTTTAGEVTYTGSGTSISAWHGSTQLLVDQNSTYGNNTFRVTGASGSNITVGSASGADGATARVYGDHSLMTQDTASITYTIVIKDEAGVETTYTKVQTFAKSWQGDAGEDGGAGSTGPAIAYRGVFSATTVYYNNSLLRDIVKYGDTYYFYTGTDAQSGAWNASNWTSLGASFSSVATGLLFAEYAVIDNLGVRYFSGTPVPAGDLSGTVVNTTPNIPLSSIYLPETTYNTGDKCSIGGTVNYIALSDGINGIEPPNETYWGTENIQKRKDTVTLTGSSGKASIVCDGLTGDLEYNVNGLTQTAVDFVTLFAADYLSGGVVVTSSGVDIIFEASVAGVDFTGSTEIYNIPNVYKGSLNIQGNDIWENNEDSNTTGVVAINRRGLNGGQTRYRHFYVFDGKGSMILGCVGGDPSYIWMESSRIRMPHLPTSSPGKGYLYQDGGVVKIGL